MTKTLQTGRDAFDRHDWAAAVEMLDSVDRETRLAPEDLERLGTARWWVGQLDEATDAFERAFAAYQRAGRSTDAARAALELAYRAFRGLASPVGAGWLAQAGRLLAGAPESGSHAWLGVFNTIGAFEARGIDQAIAAADEAMAIARRQDEPGALFVAMSFKGSAELAKGHVEAGLALIDEAAAAISSGRLDVRIASDIYCNTIAACRDIGDLERSAQWAAEGERWMERNGVAAYPGVCRLHRAELKMLHGNWPEAEQEARLACQELERYRMLDVVGYGHYQVGEVRLRMGDLDGAAAAFDRAYEYGHDAQPGLALLQLARGEVQDARRSIDRALATAAGSAGVANRVTRGRLLPARIEIALASRDLEAARESVDELESVAAAYARPLFRAGAMTARGELLLGEDKASEASPILSQSWRLWQASDLPYESARARLHYAEALAAEGDEAMARRDLQAARGVFERLGATLDLERVDTLLRAGGAAAGAVPGAADGSKSGARVTKTFMFTDIVTSTDLVGVIGDEAWSDVLGWHDRELRSAFATHSGEEVSHTGDGFFVAFERAGDAIACAVDVQRRLARHRREHGFAPWVRIGLHTAEATRRGMNYTGAGVHVAARVGAAAGRDAILVSGSLLRAAGPTRFILSEPRSMTLKGVREPVEVRSVEWR